MGDKTEITQEQAQALRKFWWHMCNRIARDANIQWYCGAMTRTLELAVESYSVLHPDRDPKDFESDLMASGVASDADVCRLMDRIKELEAAS